jgi:hypothetical protein
MGARVDLALWIYREHFAALALLGAWLGVARVASQLVLGTYAVPLVLLASGVALIATASLVWCVARRERPSLRVVLNALEVPLRRPSAALKALARRALRLRVQLVALALGAFALQTLVGEGVGAFSEAFPLFGEWSDLMRLWVASLGTGLLEPVLYVAAALWIFEPEG